MDIYTHVNMDSNREIAETLAKAMGTAQPEPDSSSHLHQTSLLW